MEEPHGEVGLFGYRNEAERVSELEAQTELHDARVVRAVEQKGLGVATIAAEGNDGPGAGGGSASPDLVELRVVKDVEVLPTEFEGVAFLEGEALEEAEVEIQASGEINGVAPEGACGETDGSSESVRVVVENSEYASVGGPLCGGHRIGIAD